MPFLAEIFHTIGCRSARAKMAHRFRDLVTALPGVKPVV
jgi:hypothetical protein